MCKLKMDLYRLTHVLRVWYAKFKSTQWIEVLLTLIQIPVCLY